MVKYGFENILRGFNFHCIFIEKYCFLWAKVNFVLNFLYNFLDRKSFANAGHSSDVQDFGGISHLHSIGYELLNFMFLVISAGNLFRNIILAQYLHNMFERLMILLGVE